MKILQGYGSSTMGLVMVPGVGSGSVIDTSKRYVLVVEDNKMISEILVETLRSMGMEAVVAENGKIAVDKFSYFIKEG